jgi:hypothetical protein
MRRNWTDRLTESGEDRPIKERTVIAMDALRIAAHLDADGHTQVAAHVRYGHTTTRGRGPTFMLLTESWSDDECNAFDYYARRVSHDRPANNR